MIYEIWSITTGNRYGETFTDRESAERMLARSREAWPDSEFEITECEDEPPDGSREGE